MRPEINTFWSYYCNSVDKNREIYFSEVVGPSRVMSLELKLTFSPQKQEIHDTEQLFDRDFLQRFLAIIRNYIDVNFYRQVNKIHEQAVVLHSEPWSEPHGSNRDILVNCVYLQVIFYNMRVDTQKYNKIYVDEIITELARNNITDMLKIPLVVSLDKSVIRKNEILMYGSINQDIRSKIAHCYVWDAENLILDNEPDLILDQFSFECHKDIRDNSVPATIVENNLEDSDNYYYIFPFYFSTNYPPDEIFIQNKEFRKNDESSNLSREVINEEEEFDLCIRFVNMLSPERFIKHETQFHDIGRAFYNATEGHENGVQEWIKATKNVLEKIQGANPYFIKENVEITCRRAYDTFERSLVTYKTLAWYASVDNPVEYRKWHDAWFRIALQESILEGGTETDVARAFYRCYWLQYLYCPGGGRSGTWYRFRKHRWQEIVQGLKGLRDVISGRFVKFYEEYHVYIAEQIRNISDSEEMEKKKWEKRVTELLKLIKLLKRPSFKDGIVKELSCIFAHEQFKRCHDENYLLTAVQNGVLEIIDDRVIFREGKPEDFITMAMDVQYHKDYTLRTPIVQELLSWLHKVFPDEAVFTFACKVFASLLIGRNTKKKLFVMTGSGNNSKSMIVRLIEETLGSFYFKLPVEALSQGNRNAAGPSPHMAQSRSTRVGIAEEPEKTVMLRASIIKQMTGNDRQFHRFLNDNGGSFVQTYKTFICCNDPPMIPNPDEAIRRRVCIIPFVSTWQENAPESLEEQYKLRRFKEDGNFEQKIPPMAPAFLWLMVKYYPEFVKNFDFPEEVKKSCDEYWINKDIYALYVRERVKLRDPRGTYSQHVDNITLKWKDLYNDFKQWYRENYAGNKVPDSGLAKGEFTRHLGDIIVAGSGWVGHELIEIQNAEPTGLTTALPLSAGGMKMNIVM